MSRDLRVASGKRKRGATLSRAEGGPDQSEAQRPPLRERKKQRTLAQVQRQALRLFVKQGYEETTIEQIAEAVEVSPSTVYRYFPTKEDLVLSDEYDPLIFAAIGSGPAEESAIAAVRRALVVTLAPFVERDRATFLTRGRLMLAVPALRARLWDFLQQNETTLCQIFAARSGRDQNDFELRVAAGAILGVIVAAMSEWVRSEGKADISDLVDRALRELEGGLAQIGRKRRRR